MKQTTSKYQSSSKFQKSQIQQQKTSYDVNVNDSTTHIINPYSIINEINECYDNNRHEYVDKALNMIVGLIKNDLFYKFFDYNGLMELGKTHPDVYAIQINDTTFAVPNYLDKENKIHSVVFMKYDKETKEITDKINYDLVNEIHEDLNKILSIFNIPVAFKGIKHLMNGRLYPIPRFNCTLQHVKLSISALKRVIYEVFKHENDIAMTYSERNEYEQLLRHIDVEHDTIFDSTIIEYSKFLEEATTKSLFYVPDEFIVKKDNSVDNVRQNE